MYTLAFDTTAAYCSVALLQDNKIARTFEKNMDFGQSEALMPAIRDVLSRERISFQDINLITVCTGPGSFTGVRSSVSAARTFALARPALSVTGVSAFEAYAFSLLPEELADINAVIIETKRADFYYQLFDRNLRRLTEPAADITENIIPQLRDVKVSFIGDGVERFLSRPTGLSLHAIRMGSHVSVEHLAWCGLKMFLDKKLDFPKPLYLRAPDVSLPAPHGSAV